MINSVQILGRIASPFEVKETEKSAMYSFLLKSKVGFGKYEKDCFAKCQAWGKLGKAIVDHVKQGSLIYISGNLQSYLVEKEDNEFHILTVNVQNVRFIPVGTTEVPEAQEAPEEPEANKEEDNDVPFCPYVSGETVWKKP